MRTLSSGEKRFVNLLVFYLRVIESKNPTYPIGSYIYGHFGWRTLTLVKNPDDSKIHPIKPYPCPELTGYPKSFALGCCGRPGYFVFFFLHKKIVIL